MRTSSILISILCLFVLSCQKENLAGKKIPANPKEESMVKNVKKYYDIIKAANNHQIIERDGISLTIDEALSQVETLFSYAYGDYSITNDSTYTFIDTAVINFGSTPIQTADFVSITNQTLEICKAQFNQINYSGSKYFYSVSMRKLSSTATSATVTVKSVFGSKYTPVNDLTPIGEWPTTVFDNKFDKTYYHDFHTCENPTGVNYNSQQAPAYLVKMINKYKSYLNYDPFYAISQGQPNPYENMVLGGVIDYFGSSQRKRISSVDHEIYSEDGNHWDWLLHQRNPNDPILNDCIDEYNCFKIAVGLNNENSFDCINNTRSKCLSVAEMNHYFNRLMSCVLETMNHYHKNYFVGISTNPYVPSGVCVDSECSYWMNFSILIGDMYFVETKTEDKIVFPNKI